jgi:hypothetical protein
MMFDVPFDEVGRIVVRTTVAAKLLASRARRRVRGAAAVPDADLSRQREVVDAFLAASRAGDFDALVALLDPDVVLRADLGPTTGGSLAAGARGRRGFRKGLMFARLATSTRPALVNGAVGAVSSQYGRLTAVLRFIVAHQRSPQSTFSPTRAAGPTSPDTPRTARDRFPRRPTFNECSGGARRSLLWRLPRIRWGGGRSPPIPPSRRR